MKRNFLMVLMLLLTLSVTAQTKEQQLLARVDAYNKATFINKDSATLEELLADKLTYGHSSGKLEDKKVMIHHAVSNTMLYPTFTADSTTVMIEGNTGIVRQIIKSKTIDKGIEGTLHLGILQVWIYVKGKWILYARQAVKV